MIRKILRVNSDTVFIGVPKSYMGKMLEIIAFTTDEEQAGATTPRRKPSFDAASIDTRGFEFNRDKANER